MLYCVAYFIFVYYIVYSFLYVHTGTYVVIERLTPPYASFSRACRSEYLVCLCRKLTKRIYFVAYLVVGFHSHLHISSFKINTNSRMKGECKAVPSMCKRRGGIYFLTESSDFCYNILDLES